MSGSPIRIVCMVLASSALLLCSQRYIESSGLIRRLLGDISSSLTPATSSNDGGVNLSRILITSFGTKSRAGRAGGGYDEIVSSDDGVEASLTGALVLGEVARPSQQVGVGGGGGGDGDGGSDGETATSAGASTLGAIMANGEGGGAAATSESMVPKQPKESSQQSHYFLSLLSPQHRSSDEWDTTPTVPAGGEFGGLAMSRAASDDDALLSPYSNALTTGAEAPLEDESFRTLVLGAKVEGLSAEHKDNGAGSVTEGAQGGATGGTGEEVKETDETTSSGMSKGGSGGGGSRHPGATNKNNVIKKQADGSGEWATWNGHNSAGLTEREKKRRRDEAAMVAMDDLLRRAERRVATNPILWSLSSSITEETATSSATGRGIFAALVLTPSPFLWAESPSSVLAGDSVLGAGTLSSVTTQLDLQPRPSPTADSDEPMSVLKPRGAGSEGGDATLAQMLGLE